MSIVYSKLPTLDFLRPHLEVPEVNTGMQYALTPNGIVTDNQEGLHAVQDEQGRVVLRSGIEFSMVVYRGQTEEHKLCVPSLARKKHIAEQLMELCRHVAFEDAIGDHPYVRICEQARFGDSPLFINRPGLAQHYGLATDMLDLTSNFDIACFFATCRWNNASHSYQPVEHATVPGVLYRMLPLALIQFSETGSLSHVGWQPFHRPEQQRACALRMQTGQNFAKLPGVQLIRFRQNRKVSVRIWKSFDEGRSLFPNDAASILAEQAKFLVQFTRGQIDRAWVKLVSWRGTGCTIDDRIRIEKSLGITIAEHPVLNWDDLDMERDEGKLRNQLNQVLANVRYRLTASID